MFDTMKVAKAIKSARIAQNMTQMNLADAMGVSYQAVSNWERGNSMPDIAKLPQLCEILHLDLAEMLGTSDAAKTVAKVVEEKDAELSLDEIENVIPLLPPREAEAKIEDALKSTPRKKIHLKRLILLAPFLDEEYLDDLVLQSESTDILAIAGLAPFLSQKALLHLAEPLIHTDMNALCTLAPFLNAEVIDQLVMKAAASMSIRHFVSLAPFLSQETLDRLVSLYMEKEALDASVAGLAPFLSKATLKKISEYFLTHNAPGILKSINPFL